MQLLLRWDLRNSNTASKYVRLQYTTNGVNYLDYLLVTMPFETWMNGQTASFASIAIKTRTLGSVRHGV